MAAIIYAGCLVYACYTTFSCVLYVVSMNSVIVDFAFFGYYCYIKCNRITY